MTESGRPLPAFLSDLTFSINGNDLVAFPLQDDPEILHLHVRCNRYTDVGLFVRLKQKTAEVKCSQAITTYKRGKEMCYVAWDPNYPTPTDAGPFEDWVRFQLIKDIDRMLAWHIEGNIRKFPIMENRDHYVSFCKDFAALPNFDMTHHAERSFIYEMLGAVHRVVTAGTVTETDEAIFERFTEAREQNNLAFSEDLAEACFNIALCVLPTIPKPLRVSIEKRVAELFTPHEASADEMSSEYLWRIVKPIMGSPKAFREQAHPHLLKLCTTTELCHVLVAAFQKFPDEAEMYIHHGLSLKPESVSLLIAAETFYLQTTENEILDHIRDRIRAFGVRPNGSTNVQAWIDRYTHLTNDFQYFKPKTNTTETVPELLEIEASLNQHWMGLVHQIHPLAREAFQKELITQNRFLSAGSSSVVGWLRNEHRYQEVVDYMMPLQADGELCLLRHKTYPRGFESFLSNGLSCFLDSQEEEHIGQALQLVGAIEPILSPWQTGDVLYALGCIAARAGETQRALTYVRQAIEKGESIESMAKDPDFRSIWEHPDFIELTQAS